jgi:hypothetical protein
VIGKDTVPSMMVPVPPTGPDRNVVFSRDPDQNYMFIGDFSNKLIRVFDRVTGKELSRFGRPGSHQLGGPASPHGIAVDSKGNVYVAESLDGRRVQRFKPMPLFRRERDTHAPTHASNGRPERDYGLRDRRDRQHRHSAVLGREVSARGRESRTVATG